MFRKRQELPSVSCGSIAEEHLVFGDNGIASREMVSQNAVLPDIEPLGELLDAGIPLEKVNTKVLDGKNSFDFSVFEKDETSKPEQPNEV